MDGMIPQSYPLGCSNSNHERFLVIGWTAAGKPVVVRHALRWDGPMSAPAVLDGEVQYYLPDTSATVTVDGTVDATVEATVRGIEREGAVLVRKQDF